MLDMLRKSFLAGIGAVAVTADKVKEATRKLVEEGKLSTEEAEKFSEDLIQSGQRQMEEFSSKFQDSMRKFSENVDVVRRKDYQALLDRVEMLEQRIAVLEAAAPAKETTISEECGTTIA